MTLEQLVPLAIKVSIVLLVFGIGLHASLRDATYLLGKPGLLARSILSMNVIMPLLAAAVAKLFDLHPAIEIAIIALALSPVPPILPGKQTKAGGTIPYAIGLLVTASLLSIVIVPVGVELIGDLFAKDIHVMSSAVAVVVLTTIVAPLLAGIAVRQAAPAFADRISKPVSSFATVLLLAAVLPLLFATWPMLKAMIGNGTLLVLALFAGFGLALGHLMGGPDEDDRTDLALATAARHPAVALAIAGATFPQERAVLAVVVWHLVVGAIASVPYVMWRRRRHAATGRS